MGSARTFIAFFVISMNSISCFIKSFSRLTAQRSQAYSYTERQGCPCDVMTKGRIIYLHISLEMKFYFFLALPAASFVILYRKPFALLRKRKNKKLSPPHASDNSPGSLSLSRGCRRKVETYAFSVTFFFLSALLFQQSWLFPSPLRRASINKTTGGNEKRKEGGGEIKKKKKTFIIHTQFAHCAPKGGKRMMHLDVKTLRIGMDLFKFPHYTFSPSRFKLFINILLLQNTRCQKRKSPK